MFFQLIIRHAVYELFKIIKTVELYETQQQSLILFSIIVSEITALKYKSL